MCRRVEFRAWQTRSALSACGVRRLQVVHGTQLQASLSTCQSENHLMSADSNPGSGDYCGSKLAYLPATVDRRRD